MGQTMCQELSVRVNSGQCMSGIFRMCQFVRVVCRCRCVSGLSVGVGFPGLQVFVGCVSLVKCVCICVRRVGV